MFSYFLRYRHVVLYCLYQLVMYVTWDPNRIVSTTPITRNLTPLPHLPLSLFAICCSVPALFVHLFRSSLTVCVSHLVALSRLSLIFCFVFSGKCRSAWRFPRSDQRISMLPKWPTPRCNNTFRWLPVRRKKRSERKQLWVFYVKKPEFANYRVSKKFLKSWFLKYREHFLRFLKTYQHLVSAIF